MYAFATPILRSLTQRLVPFVSVKALPVDFFDRSPGNVLQYRSAALFADLGGKFDLFDFELAKPFTIKPLFWRTRPRESAKSM